MPLPVGGMVGPTASNAGDGAEIDFRLGHTGETIVSQAHGRYVEPMSRGLIYAAAHTGSQAVSVALATTYTGLLLYNPVNSGKILVPLKLKFALSAAPAAIASIGLISGYAATGGVTAGTTPLLTRSAQIGNGSASSGLVYSAATIVTPTWLMQLVDGFTAATMPPPSPVVDLEGMFGILPGGFIGISALAAVTGFGSISWEELTYNVQG